MGRHDWTAFKNAGHRAVVTTVRVAERLSKAADRFLANYDLSLAQFNLLTILASRPEGLAQSEIGDALVVSRANVTGLVSRLKARELVSISGTEKDARIKCVRITTSGARLIDSIQSPYFEEIKRITRVLKSSDLKMLSDQLELLGRRV